MNPVQATLIGPFMHKIPYKHEPVVPKARLCLLQYCVEKQIRIVFTTMSWILGIRPKLP